jgi:hypothetical protein
MFRVRMIAGAPSSAPNRRRRMASPCSLNAARVSVLCDIVYVPFRPGPAGVAYTRPSLAVMMPVVVPVQF